MSNSLDPDQDQHSDVGPDLVLNCLCIRYQQTAEVTASEERVKAVFMWVFFRCKKLSKKTTSSAITNVLSMCKQKGLREAVWSEWDFWLAVEHQLEDSTLEIQRIQLIYQHFLDCQTFIHFLGHLRLDISCESYT